METSIKILVWFIGLPLGLILWRLLLSWGANININDVPKSEAKGK